MKTTLIIIFILISSFLGAQPSGYYNSANGKTGTNLELALHKIIRGHTRRSYSQLWTDFQTTDKKSNGKVWDMYSDIPGGTPSYEYTFSDDQCGTYSTEGDCYNREHSFPKSWWGGGTSSTDTMYTDLFHLVPTDGYVNYKRNNYPYGEVSSASWTSSNGCKVGSCSYTGYSGTVFEPIDEYKGDFARNYFYMATRYKNLIDSWGSNSDMLDGSEYSSWALNLLLDWHEQDPVSQKEIDRNNDVYGIQGNRNPFIDHPEYVPRIWGGNDVYAPVNSDNYPAIDNETSSGFTLNVNIDEVGTVYYVILSSGAAAPSSTQVKAGQDGSGTTLSSTYKGNITVSAGFTSYSEALSGLSTSTTYDVYFVSDDNESPSNLQDNPVKVSASTSSSGGGGGGGSYYSELMISEYVEGSSNNKYIEIWNNTGATVNLSDYAIKIYHNGSTSGSTISLSGSLSQNDTYIIANSSASAWSGTPDLSTSSLDFNGNDAVVLVNTSSKGDVDVLGTVGNSSYFAKDKTLTRNTTTSGPVTTYDASEWDNGSQDDVSGLGNEGALPMELISFSAKTYKESLEFIWITASEVNSSYFVLEASPDGTVFYPIGKLKAAGNSSVNTKYVYKTSAQKTETAYYRLKLVDMDGAFIYSSIISVENRLYKLHISSVYYENQLLHLRFNNPNNTDLIVEIIDLSGRVLETNILQLHKGDNSYTLHINSHLKGFYIIRINNQDLSEVRKIIF